jgi:hypothetical protein
VIDFIVVEMRKTAKRSHSGRLRVRMRGGKKEAQSRVRCTKWRVGKVAKKAAV